MGAVRRGYPLLETMKAYLLFEQSGTFKNEFKKLGYEAFDYDILNDFGETDYVIDLFGEIEKAYGGGTSLFDEITSEDIAIAFFPCTMFQEKNTLWFKGNCHQQAKWSDERKLEHSIERHNTLHEFYTLVSKLAVVAIRKGIRLVIENPYNNQQHYLTRYFPIEPKLIDKDRSQRGDYYKKPTQYWFINFEPKYNFIFEPLIHTEAKTIDGVKKSVSGLDRQVERSLIHPQYANRFIREFILDNE